MTVEKPFSVNRAAARKPCSAAPGRGNTPHRRGLAVVALLLLASPAVVQAQFTWTTNSGTITITKYTGPGGEVTIPDTITGRSVTSIGSSAFAYASLTNVTIPNGVTNIGSQAFWVCTNPLSSG